ncbi:transcription termination/antitermination protein NusG [Mycoplasma mycoides]|uniref:Transcription termination/antitermination protein NusG n=1 Tax=Mycoplasma mycoides subsp. capri LC str. 95010 TaxID=862259 RepID=F4MR24_MYCML|nr:transcription termination/antitermination protein NusG [Mycoplasma mycoides]ADH21622.1 transcription antitermination protein nusG [synthetic Mycoplasma mycoides JCVI-syn1.0]AMW76700.1 NusG: Transcription termination/antitermination protein [synthetic bacterium JCVI-Syn3.0]AMW77174.1 NusG: Transcription termination/antitermination protein [synthetic bacterium JCVI-Syn2.0]AVX55001.1 Antitermination protein [synthetic bacterium JCVI-Syn3A]QWN46237.1 transcription termination/antitermination pr
MTYEEIKQLEDEILEAKGQWFVISCQTGHEEKVLGDLQQKIKSASIEDEVFSIKISKANLVSKSGKSSIKNKFPGYIFINMIMSEKAWFLIRNTPGVTGFIGSSGRGAKPSPLTTEETLNMLVPNLEEIEQAHEQEQQEENLKNEAVNKKELFTANFKVGDVVRVKSGIHENEEGTVKDMDFSKGVAFVAIEMFGRWTTLEVSFKNVEPIKEY